MSFLNLFLIQVDAQQNPEFRMPFEFRQLYDVCKIRQ